MVESTLDLREQYRAVGLEKIAEYTVSMMSLHILDLIATFQKKAEQEGISSEDREETLTHILPETFRILAEMNKQVSVQSLDDLTALINITTIAFLLI